MATRIREKAAKRKENKDNRPKAIARYVRISSSKVRIILNLVRGKNYNEAFAILDNSSNKAAKPVLKVLNSAAANAENNLDMNKDDLYIEEAYATEGPTRSALRRGGKKPKGRIVEVVKKRTAHITIILNTVEDKK